MNRVTKRTWIMGLFLAVLLGGMMFFLWEYVTQAGEWVTFPGSPHVYNNANIGCGTVTDRSGNVLLDITEERTYSSDAATRQSTLHWLGDRKGYISASAVSHYAGKGARGPGRCRRGCRTRRWTPWRVEKAPSACTTIKRERSSAL